MAVNDTPEKKNGTSELDREQAVNFVESRTQSETVWYARVLGCGKIQKPRGRGTWWGGAHPPVTRQRRPTFQDNSQLFRFVLDYHNCS